MQLLIKSFTLDKDMSSGDWVVSVIETNKGKFQLGSEVSEGLDSDRVARFVDYLRAQTQPSIIEYLRQETLEQENLRRSGHKSDQSHE